jgi:hypothetical protein
MITFAEAQGWQRSRSRGLRRFLAREAFRGLVMFVVTSGVLWWMGARLTIPGGFVRRMTLFGFLIWVGGGVLFGALSWILQERRYQSRMEAEARREVRSTTGA